MTIKIVYQTGSVLEIPQVYSIHEGPEIIEFINPNNRQTISKNEIQEIHMYHKDEKFKTNELHILDSFLR